MKKSTTQEETVVQTIEVLLQLIEDCYTTKKNQTIDMELGGDDSGDTITVTMKYKGNKNANKRLN